MMKVQHFTICKQWFTLRHIVCKHHLMAGKNPSWWPWPFEITGVTEVLPSLVEVEYVRPRPNHSVIGDQMPCPPRADQAWEVSVDSCG